ncbi:MAG: lipoate--protein ligase family protein [Burkholderiaceae bacterium]|nr:lipoate--protein ligase family protein [Burkholderiaceae bacterium]
MTADSDLGDDARADEALITQAANGSPSASIWRTGQGLVVPRSYLRSPLFEQTSLQFAHAGWPIGVRQSGGGVVPQGPGIINLSLAYAVHGKPLDHSDAGYQLICDIIGQVLHGFGIDTRAQAVAGSFCDGRYNLATGPQDQPRKVVGTAQVWRRQPGIDGGKAFQVALVHAVILAHADIGAITHHANRLELALGNDRRYLDDSAASLHLCSDHGMAGPDFTTRLMAHLADHVAGLPA